MNRKLINRIGPPALFLVAVFIYAVVLGGTVSLIQLLITALIILAVWAVAARLIKPKQHRDT